MNFKINEEENKINNSNESNDLILSSTFFKKYKPIKKIGEGSFSVIYEGENIETHDKVALKLEQKLSITESIVV